MATDGFGGDGEGVHPMAKKEFLKTSLVQKKMGTGPVDRAALRLLKSD